MSSLFQLTSFLSQLMDVKRKTLLYACCVISILIFLANLIATITFSQIKYTASQKPSTSLYFADPPIYFGELFSGKSHKQAEIDKAHKKQRWLDIGFPSIRNFWHVDYGRKLAWLLLAFTAVPLHLLYNSAVYNTNPANQHAFYVVTPGFFEGQQMNVGKSVVAWDWRARQNMTGLEVSPAVHKKLVSQPIDAYEYGYNADRCGDNKCGNLTDQYTSGVFVRNVSALECLNTYSDPFSNSSNVIFQTSYDYLSGLETSVSNATNPLLFVKWLHIEMVFDFWNDYQWLCGDQSAWEKDPSIIKDWNILGWRVDRCFIREINLDNKCAVRFSPQIMIAVCVANFCKCTVILYTAMRYAKVQGKREPITVLGDALASFLTDVDDETKSLSLLDKKTIQSTRSVWSSQAFRPWSARPKLYFRAASFRRWLVTYSLYICLIVAAIGLIVSNQKVVSSRAGSTGHFTKMGFGKIDDKGFAELQLNLQTGSRTPALYAIIFFANVWQLILSGVYILLNSLLSYIFVEAEWQSYATKKKPLRVSFPTGKQRSTYFLAIPYRYGVPIQILFFACHWMLSQGLSLEVIETYRLNSFEDGDPFLQTSGIALILTVVLSFITVGTVFLIGFKKHPGYMPLGATCSAVISAACHRPADDTGAAYQPVQWGVIDVHEHDNQAQSQSSGGIDSGSVLQGDSASTLHDLAGTTSHDGPDVSHEDTESVSNDTLIQIVESTLSEHNNNELNNESGTQDIRPTSPDARQEQICERPNQLSQNNDEIPEPSTAPEETTIPPESHASQPNSTPDELTITIPPNTTTSPNTPPKTSQNNTITLPNDDLEAQNGQVDGHCCFTSFTVRLPLPDRYYT
ncbi:hypothetical protein BT63DRAFT_475106 [Microthyrium microscopicum]|uniref:DUF6536 domain-containing protein n=1 Tax=Microthyrium microscopicum TaxID=703497 RepID=A0A6A6UVJ6_9PEZI|nr:hypothetical protein BT63DRAFT_475106 [Microthyrium microscopicum]